MSGKRHASSAPSLYPCWCCGKRRQLWKSALGTKVRCGECTQKMCNDACNAYRKGQKGIPHARLDKRASYCGNG